MPKTAAGTSKKSKRSEARSTGRESSAPATSARGRKTAKRSTSAQSSVVSPALARMANAPDIFGGQSVQAFRFAGPEISGSAGRS